MEQYKRVVRNVLSEGVWQENRTGIRTISAPGQAMEFYLDKGFPLLTLKKVPIKAIVGELIAFLKGKTNAADFRALGCNVWDQNANENAQWLQNPFRQGLDDLGAIYGDQWRNWPCYKVVPDMPDNQALHVQLRHEGWEQIGWTTPKRHGSCERIYYRQYDQIRECLRKLIYTPEDRRILFHAWNLAKLDEMALAPCHLLYQFHPHIATRKLSLTLYIRSNDLGLGNPFNVAEAALLLQIFAELTAFKPHKLTVFIGDAHIYENHMEMVTEMLAREDKPLPTMEWILNSGYTAKPSEMITVENVHQLTVDGCMKVIEALEPEHFILHNYDPHPAIKAPMAV